MTVRRDWRFAKAWLYTQLHGNRLDRITKFLSGPRITPIDANQMAEIIYKKAELNAIYGYFEAATRRAADFNGTRFIKSAWASNLNISNNSGNC